MSRLLIDGYNVIHSLPYEAPPGEEEMDHLFALLSRYRKLKGHTITVVLDGHEGGTPLEHRERILGIAVIYSKLGERADQVIERLNRRWGGSCVVVTSDRALADSVEEDGAAVIGSAAFAEQLQMTDSLTARGAEDPEEPEMRRIHTRKKGNPKRKSKKERARLRRIRKL
jgi:predicted RNA-binding protein with PIN domain